MKRFYRTHFHPKIAPNGQLVHFKDSKEILSVLGFCASEVLSVEVESKSEVEGSPGLAHVLVGAARNIISDDHKTLTIKKEVRSKGRSPKVKAPS